MLMVVILERFREPHSRQPRFVKWIVIAAAPVAVHAENQPYRRAPVDFFHCARKFPRRRVRIVNLAVTGEKPCAMRPARRRVRANNVVVQHSADCVTLLLHPVHKVSAAEQPLLFAGNRCKQYRGAIFPAPVRPSFAKQSRALHAHCYARGIVIRTGSVRLRIHHVRWPRIKVPGNDEDSFRELFVGTRQDGVHIFERNRLP